MITPQRLWILRSPWLRIHIVSALVVSAAAWAAVAACAAAAISVWRAVASVLLAALLVCYPVSGRTLVAEWPMVLWRFMRRRRTPFAPPSAAYHVDTLAGRCAIMAAGPTLIAAVEISPPASLTYAVTDDAGTQRALTDAVLPVRLVTDSLSQYGLDFDIDIVSCGQHFPAASTYWTLYSNIVGPGPLVAQRRTWLLIRLDTNDNLAALGQRGPARTAAPRALATAAYRLAERLGGHNIGAHVLDADALGTLEAALRDCVDAPSTIEQWKTVARGDHRVTTYVGDPNALSSDSGINAWWGWPTDATTVVLRLRAGENGKPIVSALVRYQQVGTHTPPVAGLLHPGGVQRDLLKATLVTGTDPDTDAAIAAVGLPHHLSVPISPAGPVIGHSGAGLAALALTDHSHTPALRRIDARITAAFLHRIVLRAVTTGAIVAVHTDHLDRWGSLMAAVNDPSKLFFASGSKQSDLAVFDGKPVTAVPTRTTMAVQSPQSTTARDTGAAIQITQTDPTHLQVRIRRRALSTNPDPFEPPVDITFLINPAEDRYLGVPNEPETRRPRQPRRTPQHDPNALRRENRKPRKPHTESTHPPVERRQFATAAPPTQSGRTQPDPPDPPSTAPRRTFILPPQQHRDGRPQ